LGAIYWVIKSVMDAHVFRQGPFMEKLLHPGLEEITARSLVVLIVLLFSLYARSIIRRHQGAYEDVRQGELRQAEESIRLAQERMEQQLESARIIQQSFLPARLPWEDDPRFDLAAVNLPASSVGGDYYDVILHGRDRLSLVVGDVSGKGIPAAIYMARLVSDFRFVMDPYKGSPAKTLEGLNRHLLRRGHSGMFITLLYLILDLNTGLITFANAGHIPFLIRSTDGSVEVVDGAAGPPLGIIENLVYEDTEITIFPGNELLLYTDGVTEAMNDARESFTRQRLIEVVRPTSGRPEALVNTVVEAVRAFTGESPVHDDITLLTARWNGADRSRW
jgi:sigma-B regulation protein RsbU (phosphoserine phosphatase)